MRVVSSKSGGDGDVDPDEIIVRVTGDVALIIPPVSTIAQLRKAINAAFTMKQDLTKKLKFNLKNSNFSIEASSPKEAECSSLYSYFEDEATQEIDDLNISKNDKIKMREKLATQRLIERQMINFQYSDLEDSDMPQERELVLNFEKKIELKTKIVVDVIFFVKPNTTLKDFYKNSITSIRQQYDEMKAMMLHFLTVDETKLHLPSVYHFRPEPIWPDFLSIMYPSSMSDIDLTDYRKSVLDEYNRVYKYILPTDRPYIRKANRYKFPNELSKLLINPHNGLKRLFTDGQVGIVNGNYAYHHYMQDGIDDNGWGCAYRSLQTIISWFSMQGYIEIEKVPDHKTIQKTLVEVGDKEPSFVGTRKWIGSQEVGYVLNQLYGITSKTMFVSNGKELASKGRELLNHFETHGTPVMIGGGVLAHTILGVDFNEKNGDLAFLILDPHYTGGEDLSIVQKKGWCGWKLPDFWDPHSFYNCCLPQRTETF